MISNKMYEAAYVQIGVEYAIEEVCIVMPLIVQIASNLHTAQYEYNLYTSKLQAKDPIGSCGALSTCGIHAEGMK